MELDPFDCPDDSKAAHQSMATAIKMEEIIRQLNENLHPRISQDTLKHMADVKLLDDNGLKSLGPISLFLRLKVKNPLVERILTEILSRMLTSIIVDRAQQKNQKLQMYILRSMHGGQNWIWRFFEPKDDPEFLNGSRAEVFSSEEEVSRAYPNGIIGNEQDGGSSSKNGTSSEQNGAANEQNGGSSSKNGTGNEQNGSSSSKRKSFEDDEESRPKKRKINVEAEEDMAPTAGTSEEDMAPTAGTSAEDTAPTAGTSAEDTASTPGTSEEDTAPTASIYADEPSSNVGESTPSSVYAEDHPVLLNPHFPSILELLEIDHPVITKFLIERCRIDRTLVVPQLEDFMLNKDKYSGLIPTDVEIIGRDHDGNISKIDPNKDFMETDTAVVGYMQNITNYGVCKQQLIFWGGKDIRNRWDTFCDHLNAADREDTPVPVKKMKFSMPVQSANPTTSFNVDNVGEVEALLAARGISVTRR